MSTIPKSLLEAISIINKNSQTVNSSCFLMDKVEEETDRVLSVSASLKQIVWDLLPDQELDAEFADAYMEELEESDEGDDASKLPSDDSDSYAESIAEVVTIDSHRPFSISADVLVGDSADQMQSEYFPRANSHFGLQRSLSVYSLERVQNKFSAEADRVKPYIREQFEAQSVSGNFLHKKMSYTDSKDDSVQNRYVSIQDVCDEAGMIAYNLIGHFLQKFSHEQNVNLDSGNVLYLRGYSSLRADVQAMQDEPCDENGCGTRFIEAIKEVLPSLPKSDLERLKEMVWPSTMRSG